MPYSITIIKYEYNIVKQRPQNFRKGVEGLGDRGLRGSAASEPECPELGLGSFGKEHSRSMKKLRTALRRLPKVTQRRSARVLQIENGIGNGNEVRGSSSTPKAGVACD